MVFSANIVTVAEMQLMAGENRDATSDVDANHIILQDMAEGYLSALLKLNLGGTGFTDLDATTRYLITEWAARFAGINLITPNMAGYTSRVEAEDMINVHIYRMVQIEKLLTEEDTKTFLGIN